MGRAPGPLSPPTMTQLMPVEVDRAEIFQQRLDRQEAYFGGSLSKMLDPRQAVLAIFDAHTPPDVFALRGELQPAAQGDRGSLSDRFVRTW